MLQDLLSELSLGLVPKADLDRQFDLIAIELLKNTTLVSGKNNYCIHEIEFYYSNPKIEHEDAYIHRNPRQALFAKWYFHRFKTPKGYENQKRKGLDLTFGNAQNTIYGGILIRKIQNTTDDSPVISGIGLLTKAIMDDLGGDFETVATSTTNSVFDSAAILRLEKGNNSLDHSIYKQARKGLNVKATDVKAEYLQKQYNYFIGTGLKLVLK